MTNFETNSDRKHSKLTSSEYFAYNEQSKLTFYIILYSINNQIDYAILL